jgi:geranylgeranyl diphosphate synthase type II
MMLNVTEGSAASPSLVHACQSTVPNPPVSPATDASSGIDDLRPLIESALVSACRFGPGCPAHLSAAIQYALLAPGKRLRPALVLMAAEACGGSLDGALPGAVAVEMIHAYSLIHDDLPAMDDDDLRRGQPTVHIEFGEATAILAGDALLAEAFSHLCQHVPDHEMVAEAIGVLARAAGPTQLVGGQADDLAAESLVRRPESADLEQGVSKRRMGEQSSLQHLESIHRRKTGALIAASLDLGAILAGANSPQRDILANYARDIGLAFQVVDDLLDYMADAESMGKRTGKDANRGKLTYPGLLGADSARYKAEQLIESARRHVSVFGSAGWRLTWLASYVLERTH